jgi:hypothetical protein
MPKAFRDAIEAPCSKLQGMFCPTAVLRADCKEFYSFSIRSLTLQQAAGNALAVAVHRVSSNR